jgi:hypothetical protein
LVAPARDDAVLFIVCVPLLADVEMTIKVWFRPAP